MTKDLSSLKIQIAAKKFNRRTVLKAAVAGGAVAATGPFFIRRSLAASHEVNVFAWGDYIQKNISDAFKAKTGITINLSTYGSNEEVQSKLKAAGGKGFDLIFPSVDTRPEYDEGNLLSEIDESRVKVDQIETAVWRSSLKLGAAKRGKRHLIPFNWGTEGVTYDSSVFDFKPGELSYGHLWGDNLEGKVAGRQKSLVITLAIYLDSIGKISSNRGMDLYKSEADMRRVLDGCLEFMKPLKKNIGAFWNNATEATSAFTDAGCTIGQTWDTTGIKLRNDVDKKWVYTAPKEGALGWMDTMAIPSGATNVDEAYELINFLMTPEIGGMFANNTGYNSAAVGSAAFLNDASKEAFKIAYPEGAIENLWWWPMSTPWFSSVRQEYVEKMTAL
ncbi:Spermidine/putrescine import ABC transporter substrate-binding protein PotD (TC 3.A.1.11.1) [hydrothermal vent metagenome]|uniref:Spermidine/putrescine import ABC transporter substrate-binding protein PotD (TC 3.A.1.11.1) n=1 Tax=hydrothermal vent metagenome TaxID=652676 RepID=A0A3B0U1D2_9ZZZZ